MNQQIQKLFEKYPWSQSKPNVVKHHFGWFGDANRKMLHQLIGGSTQVIVELGAWLGMSTEYILQESQQGTVISIDHWQGSREHYENETIRAMLPTLYETFLVNLWEYRNRLIPLRSETVTGLHEIHQYGIRPDLVYIDASHEYEDVISDLEITLKLFPECIVCGDDWPWDGVRCGVSEIAKKYEKKIHLVDNLVWFFSDED